MKTQENILGAAAYQGLQGGMAAATQAEQNAEAIAIADFNRRVEAEEAFHGQHAHHVHKQISQRRLRPFNQKTSGKDEANKGESAESHEDESGIQAMGGKAVDALIKGGETHLESQVLADCDVLERHSVLRNAHDQVDERDDLSDEKKGELKAALNDKLSELMEKHGDAINEGIKTTKAFGQALDTMQNLVTGAGGVAGKAFNEIRKTLNEKIGKKGINPFTPLGLAKKLQESFGAASFSKGMATLRTKLATKLHDNQVNASVPRIWLSLSDAACFNAVQSSFAIAEGLHRDLSKLANVLPKMDLGATAISLLGAPSWGNGGASNFANQIIGSGTFDKNARLAACSLCHQAVSSLPETLWSIDKMPQRLSTLDELRNMSLHDASIPQQMEEDRLQEHLRSITVTA